MSARRWRHCYCYVCVFGSTMLSKCDTEEYREREAMASLLLLCMCVWQYDAVEV